MKNIDFLKITPILFFNFTAHYVCVVGYRVRRQRQSERTIAV